MPEYVATVGTFDGLHLGHADLLRQLRSVARTRNLKSCVITFDTHPLATLAPERCPKLLGQPDIPDIDRVTRMHFTKAMADLTVRQFIRMLRDRYSVRILIMGYNNRIGSDGNMSREQYVLTGADEGVEIMFATPYEFSDGKYPASSAIRAALEKGDIENANLMLGRAYEISGTVSPGKQNGRKLGFPTLNLAVDPLRQLPASGVYAGFVHAPSGKYKAVINIGNNPTIAADNPVTVEAHAIDCTVPETYGDTISVSFVACLRGEHRFDSLDALKAAIASDIKKARGIL